MSLQDSNCALGFNKKTVYNIIDKIASFAQAVDKDFEVLRSISCIFTRFIE